MKFSICFAISILVAICFAIPCIQDYCPNGWCPYAALCTETGDCDDVTPVWSGWERPVTDCVAFNDSIRSKTTCETCAESYGMIWCSHKQECVPLYECPETPLIPTETYCTGCEFDNTRGGFSYIEDCTNHEGCGFFYDHFSGGSGRPYPQCVPKLISDSYNGTIPHVYDFDDVSFVKIPYILGGGCVAIIGGTLWLLSQSSGGGGGECVLLLVGIVIGLLLPSLTLVVGLALLAVVVIPVLMIILRIYSVFEAALDDEEGDDHQIDSLSLVSRIICYPLLTISSILFNYTRFVLSIVIMGFSVGKGVDFADNAYHACLTPLRRVIGSFLTDWLITFLSFVTWVIDSWSQSIGSLFQNNRDPYFCPAGQRAIAMCIFCCIPVFLMCASCLSIGTKYNTLAAKFKQRGVLNWIFGLGLNCISAVLSLVFKLSAVSLAAGVQGLFYSGVPCTWFGSVFSWVVGVETAIILLVTFLFGCIITVHGLEVPFQVFDWLFNFIAGDSLNTPSSGSPSNVVYLFFGIFNSDRLSSYAAEDSSPNYTSMAATFAGVTEAQSLWLTSIPGGYVMLEYFRAISQYTPFYEVPSIAHRNLPDKVHRFTRGIQWAAALISFIISITALSSETGLVSKATASLFLVSGAQIFSWIVVNGYVYFEHGSRLSKQSTRSPDQQYMSLTL